MQQEDPSASYHVSPSRSDVPSSFVPFLMMDLMLGGKRMMRDLSQAKKGATGERLYYKVQSFQSDDVLFTYCKHPKVNTRDNRTHFGKWKQSPFLSFPSFYIDAGLRRVLCWAQHNGRPYHGKNEQYKGRKRWPRQTFQSPLFYMRS